MLSKLVVVPSMDLKLNALYKGSIIETYARSGLLTVAVLQKHYDRLEQYEGTRTPEETALMQAIRAELIRTATAYYARIEFRQK